MEDHFDEYEHYNFDYNIPSSHSGKGRSKKEASRHTNHHDVSGHTRKTVQKLINSHHNEHKSTQLIQKK